jgi:hypothetical protein
MFLCCLVEVSVTSWSLVQRGITDCAASLLCVINKHRGRGGHSPRWAAEPEKIINNIGIMKGYTPIFYGVHSRSCVYPTVWATQRTWTFYYLCEWLPPCEKCQGSLRRHVSFPLSVASVVRDQACTRRRFPGFGTVSQRRCLYSSLSVRMSHVKGSVRVSYPSTLTD